MSEQLYPLPIPAAGRLRGTEEEMRFGPWTYRKAEHGWERRCDGYHWGPVPPNLGQAPILDYAAALRRTLIAVMAERHALKRRVADLGVGLHQLADQEQRDYEDIENAFDRLDDAINTARRAAGGQT